MNNNSKIITLPCDCKCCMFVIEKTLWEDGDICYDISIQDSRYDHNLNSLWGRLRRAAGILFGKPVYYNDVHLEDTGFIKLVQDMDALAKADLNEKKEK